MLHLVVFNPVTPMRMTTECQRSSGTRLLPLKFSIAQLPELRESWQYASTDTRVPSTWTRRTSAGRAKTAVRQFGWAGVMV